MTHIKNTSFGYTSTLLRLFHRVDIHLSEDTVINVYLTTNTSAASTSKSAATTASTALTPTSPTPK